MKFREIMSHLILDLLLCVTALIIALVPLPTEVKVLLPIIVFVSGAIIVYREEERKKQLRYREEKRKKELRFINRLEDFVKVFNEKITESGYVNSFVSIAYRIAYDKKIREKTNAWFSFLHHLNDELTKKGIILDEKVKQRKEEFTSLFRDFSSLLSLLRKFKKLFYAMINDTKKFKSFSNDSQFKKEYKRFYEEFNRYMNKLEIFSDEVKAEFGISLSKDLTAHVKDFNELHPEKVKKL